MCDDVHEVVAPRYITTDGVITTSCVSPSNDYEVHPYRSLNAMHLLRLWSGTTSVNAMHLEVRPLTS